MTNQYFEYNFNKEFPEAYKVVFANERLRTTQEPINTDDSIYFNTSNTTTTNNTSNIKPLFKIEKEEEKKLLEKKTNRGRLKNEFKNENSENDYENKNKIHDKKSLDNMKNKIQVNAINCLRKCVNCLKFHFDKKKDKKEIFRDIDANFKKNVKNKEFEEMKKKKLYEILTQNISSKYLNYEKDYNHQLYEKMKKESVYKELIEFLNEDFLYFFQNVYYKKERTINFHKYGLDTEITLSNEVKLLFDKMKTFDDKDIEYKKYINNCINDNYFDGKIMFLLEE